MPLAAQKALAPHAWSVAQAAAQQTFTLPAPVPTQLPLAHSLAALQPEPRASGSLHSPPMHVYPDAQAPGFPVQLVAHTPPEHL